MLGRIVLSNRSKAILSFILFSVVSTTLPSNEAELQLYRVLQRASLLAYYDTLLEMGMTANVITVINVCSYQRFFSFVLGGDDVQQLCDAGEDEFLEIMALVGMASKPLHVRRFQKVLAEWINNPLAFQVPLSNIGTIFIKYKHIEYFLISFLLKDTTKFECSPESVVQSRSPFMTTCTSSLVTGSPSMSSTFNSLGRISSNLGNSIETTSSTPSNSIQLSPTLTETQVARLTLAAERYVSFFLNILFKKYIVHYSFRRLSAQYRLPDIKPQNPKKRPIKEIDAIVALSESDPQRMEGIRKYSAIYGRFDCKRRPEKPLTLHEVCVNEAAAQMCKYIPALLTRRVDLFPLARQVVKDAGFGQSASIARITMG